jgi:hypothetical protein
VPDVAEGDRLLSLFTSLPENLTGVLECEQTCCAVLTECKRKHGWR